MTHNPFDTRAGDAQKEAERLRMDLAEKQAVSDWKWLMGHKAGRRLVWRLLADAGVFRNPFHASGSQMAFNCGQQNFGQRILAEVMNHCPDRYTEMLAESMQTNQKDSP